MWLEAQLSMVARSLEPSSAICPQDEGVGCLWPQGSTTVGCFSHCAGNMGPCWCTFCTLLLQKTGSIWRMFGFDVTGHVTPS